MSLYYLWATPGLPRLSLSPQAVVETLQRLSIWPWPRVCTRLLLPSWLASFFPSLLPTSSPLFLFTKCGISSPHLALYCKGCTRSGSCGLRKVTARRACNSAWAGSQWLPVTNSGLSRAGHDTAKPEGKTLRGRNDKEGCALGTRPWFHLSALSLGLQQNSWCSSLQWQGMVQD